jgi:hypothetical protein
MKVFLCESFVGSETSSTLAIGSAAVCAAAFAALASTVKQNKQYMEWSEMR